MVVARSNFSGIEVESYSCNHFLTHTVTAVRHWIIEFSAVSIHRTESRPTSGRRQVGLSVSTISDYKKLSFSLYQRLLLPLPIIQDLHLYLTSWFYTNTYGTQMTFEGFYRAMLCVSAVFAVGLCPSVCHVGGLYPDDWRYRQTYFSAR